MTVCLHHCNIVLFLLSLLGCLPTPGSAFLGDRDDMTLSVPSEPHIIECKSRDQETFRCVWSSGSFQNLSHPGALRLFYYILKPKNDRRPERQESQREEVVPEWQECPKYIPSEKECFFDRNHTAIWKTYCVQLRTQDNVTYFSDDDCFTVESIVHPDPPVGLNWTLLDVSPSGLHYDVMVLWDPPPSADVSTGWMRLVYEVQYKKINSSNWEKMKPQQSATEKTIYGLQIGEEYEVRIRSRMSAFTKFGNFCEPIVISLPEVPVSDSFHFTLLLIFGLVCMVILIMLVVFSQQHRLMVILLPPVPAPKIKGIDPDLLKKGKLEELNNMLSGGGMGGLPSYAADFYQDELWVEFIEVGVEDTVPGEKGDNQTSDTQRLLALSQPTSHHHLGCSHSLSFPDDDSGRASCYDPDLQESLMLVSTLLPGQPEGDEASLGDLSGSATLEAREKLLVQSQPGGPQTWVNTDFYAQVRDVTPSGGVVLSPGQQLRVQETVPVTEEEKKKKESKKEGEEEEEEKKSEARPKEPELQLLMMYPDSGGYTTEGTAWQVSTHAGAPVSAEGYQTMPPQSMETKPQPPAILGAYQSPYILPKSPESPFLPPVSDYTVVQEVDCQHSLLLNPPSPQTPPPRLPQHPLKPLPAMPIGYISPDFLGNLSP